MSDDPLLIIGTGIAACGAIHQLVAEGVRPVCYDQNAYPGGHTATFSTQSGFLFDDGPHISFTKDRRIQDLFAANVHGNYEVVQTNTNNHWKGYWFKHPVQCNLYGLPTDLVIRAVQDFIEAQQRSAVDIQNYEQWLRASFGDTIAETFPMAYGRKYHTTHAANMSTDWLGPRLYRPSLEEVLRGALNPNSNDVHYVDQFRYPSEGGFFSYVRPFLDGVDVRLNQRLVALDPSERKATFESGESVSYRGIVSSVPLPDLVPMLAGVPDDVRSAAETLAATHCVLVNIGVDREDLSEAHWTYFYDEDFIFTRLSFPHMLSSTMTPPGGGSIQCECYYSRKYRPLDVPAADHVAPAIADLKRCGILREEDRILHAEAREVPYANVIFDLERNDALATVHGYLDDVRVHYCGRYGEWGYQWTDESFQSGERAARAALGQPRRRPKESGLN